MELIMFYLIFVLATSFTAMYELFEPVLRELGDFEPENNLIEYKNITRFVMFLGGLLMAPVLVVFCITPSMGDRFRKSLLLSLRQA